MSSAPGEPLDEWAVHFECKHLRVLKAQEAVRVTYEGPTVPRVFSCCIQCAVHVHAYLMDMAAQ